ncbi:hypothetical protein MELE44368_04475 [Mycolicibacterium elephantis DSM 44368]|uniref:Uncharacterized protein n=1 Tax=Mycolicibacterium elephantis DSM 44368 TaxID=1335622 RepID=A0A439DRR5_9MYCO|nr:hypothetical protein MELE44368_04475 [Mycolicibacterium elephantis DSM 44368]
MHRTHLLRHVVVTILLGLFALVITWLCLFNGAV